MGFNYRLGGHKIKFRESQNYVFTKQGLPVGSWGSHKISDMLNMGGHKIMPPFIRGDGHKILQ